MAKRQWFENIFAIRWTFDQHRVMSALFGFLKKTLSQQSYLRLGFRISFKSIVFEG